MGRMKWLAPLFMAGLSVPVALHAQDDASSVAYVTAARMIAVDVDPSRDIRALEDVDVVIKGGELIKNDLGRRGQYPEQPADR